eukprot:4074368-Amphidinium_carterae.1
MDIRYQADNLHEAKREMGGKFLLAQNEREHKRRPSDAKFRDLLFQRAKGSTGQQGQAHVGPLAPKRRPECGDRPIPLMATSCIACHDCLFFNNLDLNFNGATSDGMQHAERLQVSDTRRHQVDAGHAAQAVSPETVNYPPVGNCKERTSPPPAPDILFALSDELADMKGGESRVRVLVLQVFAYLCQERVRAGQELLWFQISIRVWASCLRRQNRNPSFFISKGHRLTKRCQDQFKTCLWGQDFHFRTSQDR